MTGCPERIDVAALQRERLRSRAVWALRDRDVPPIFSELGHNMHAPSEVGIDSFKPLARRRTCADGTLASLWIYSKGPFARWRFALTKE
jgi:hypothetical protein